MSTNSFGASLENSTALDQIRDDALRFLSIYEDDWPGGISLRHRLEDARGRDTVTADEIDKVLRRRRGMAEAIDTGLDGRHGLDMDEAWAATLGRKILAWRGTRPGEGGEK